MGCGSCTSGSCTTKGCGNKGCATGGCNKLNTYDWFSGQAMPGIPEKENIYEIRFKNTHKDFFRNVNGLQLFIGDMVVVESDRGHNVGQVSLTGVLARLQMRKKKVKDHPERIRKIYRKASEEDLKKLQLARSREYNTLLRTREVIREMDLDMKLSDVEYQGDNTKAIFYYIADHRVDFRLLIKRLADEFRVRVEMKQIGLRFESALVGGLGPCGRELCCSTWLSDFRSVPTSAARYQNISLNPMKISGMCGRLKCCLNYELETYLDALEDIPEVNRIDTQMGRGVLQKTDIFKRIMWFSYENESTWIPVEVPRVVEMVNMNKRGVKPESLHHGEGVITPAKEEKLDFVDVVGHTVLKEEPRRRKKNKRSRDGGGPQGQNQRSGEPRQQGPRPERQQRGPRPERQERGPRPEGQPQRDRPQGPPRTEGEGSAPRENRPPRQQGPRNPNRNNRGPGRDRPPRPQGPGNESPPQS